MKEALGVEVVEVTCHTETFYHPQTGDMSSDALESRKHQIESGRQRMFVFFLLMQSETQPI